MKKFLKYSAMALLVLWLAQQTGFDEVVENLWIKVQESGLVEKVIDSVEDLTSIFVIPEDSVPESQPQSME